MLLQRTNIEKFNELFQKFSGRIFDIKLQYKFLKIKQSINAEAEIYQEQLFSNCLKFFEKDENNQPILSSAGGYKIIPEKIEECNRVLSQLNRVEVQIPDIYFSLDELEKLNLSFEELEILMPFIQN